MRDDLGRFMADYYRKLEEEQAMKRNRCRNPRCGDELFGTQRVLCPACKLMAAWSAGGGMLSALALAWLWNLPWLELLKLGLGFIFNR